MRENFWFKEREYKIVSFEEIYILEDKRWVLLSFVEIAGRWKARVISAGKPIWINRSELLEREEKWQKKVKLGLMRNKSKAKEIADAKRLKTRRKNIQKNMPVSQKALMCLQTCKFSCIDSRNLNHSETNASKYKGVREEKVTGKFSVIAMGVFIASYDCVLRANKVKLEVDAYILENSSVDIEEVQMAWRYARKIEKAEKREDSCE